MIDNTLQSKSGIVFYLNNTKQTTPSVVEKGRHLHCAQMKLLVYYLPIGCIILQSWIAEIGKPYVLFNSSVL